ncbi:MinD/ParA family ATP-binding protein [Halobellus sp. EA9]|uniref:MinD/ParA family ATP-binding protein n=1 Tax=Halobellus sp. EA9 TaxID=3421647 RepID=UPI003EBB37C1
MLAIAGGKGGSGKTTTTLGLARALDGPALAVDADCDLPNLHSLAGVPRDPPGGSPGHPDPDGRETLIRPAPRNAPDGIGSRLRRLADFGGHVLVDCPAGAGPDAAVPLRVADAVLLVATPCVMALRDAAKTAAMARALGTRVAGAVLVRARIEPPGVADLLGCPVLATVPPAATPLESPAVSRAYDGLARSLPDRQKA